jgi:putative drug exporter of the RND superfamily
VRRPAKVGRLWRGVAWAVVALRWVFLLGWIVAGLAAVRFLPTLQEAEPSQLNSLIPDNSSAVQTEERTFRAFHLPLLSRVQIVQRDPQGLSEQAQARVVARAGAVAVGHPQGRYAGLLGAIPILNTAGAFPGAQEHGTTAITYLFLDPQLSMFDQDAVAHRFAQDQMSEPVDHLVGVTGAIPARVEQANRIGTKLPLVELATVILVALVVGLHFRSFLAPIATLAAAGLAYLVAIRVLAFAGERAGISVPAEMEPLVVVLLLGIVTDYSIFFLSGMRHRLASGDSRLEGARTTTAEFMPIILTAGLIVAAATFSLLAATLGFFRALGPGLAITVMVGLVLSITFVPAMIAILGRAMFWPRRPPVAHGPEPSEAHEAPGEADVDRTGFAGRHHEHEAASWRRRVATSLTRRSVAGMATLGVTLLLVAAASGLLHAGLGISLTDELPSGTEPVRAADAAAAGFVPGITSPIEVLLTGHHLDQQEGAMSRLNHLLDGQPGVAGVIGPGSVPGPSLEPVFLTRRGIAARFEVVLQDDPLGSQGLSDLRTLQARVPHLLIRAGLRGTRASFAGDSALARETIDGTVHDLGRIAIAALAVSFVLLVIFLRALIAPLYLLAASVLALGAALGLTTYVFQDLLGHPGISYYVPFAAAVLLVALGSDYNVFVVGRIWEEARVRPLREAIAVAVPRASRAITVAGLALAGTFALLALVGILPFVELAFAMVVGILLDTFLVRSLLVPSLISLFGRASYFPRRGPTVAATGETTAPVPAAPGPEGEVVVPVTQPAPPVADAERSA